MLKRSLLAFSVLLTLGAQPSATVSAVAQVVGQSVTLTSNTVIKDPALAGTFICPARIAANKSGVCTITINIASPTDVVIPLTNLNPKDFIIPATVILKAGTLSVDVPITATP